MFDSTKMSNKQVVNAVSGTLVKSHPKSYFMIGHVNSKNTDGLMGKRFGKIILQVMVIGDNYLMYEVVDSKDLKSEE